MKKFFYVFLALTTAAMIACDPQPKPDDPDNPDTPDDPEVESIISVTDGSIADWDNVPAGYLAQATCAEKPDMNGLKSVKVFADDVYINILVQYNTASITSKDWDNSFHVYLNSDNSNNTGGYGDEFADPNADILLETTFWAGGAIHEYNPAVFHWFGGVGADGWTWTDPTVEASDANGWGAIVPTGALPIGKSQMVGQDMVEIQLLRELIPAPTNAPWNDKAFGIGFDIQESYTSVGILPNANADEGGNRVKANKLTVSIYHE